MAPGRVEDAKGVPFVGQAGSLLRNELRRIGLDPTAAYYMNVVSCAPPKNKLTSEYIIACRQNLKDQLDIAGAGGAEWVLVCGSYALEAMIPHATKLTRNHIIKIHNKIVYGVYHPSYILRARDRAVYEDWKMQLEFFRVYMLNPDLSEFFYRQDCIYCGDTRNTTLSLTPVCKKHMRLWRADIKWKYTPPPQLQMEM